MIKIEPKSTIELKGIIDEDFVNYKVPSMVLLFPYCSFKCGKDICQNALMDQAIPLTISIDDIYKRYVNNKIVRAVVLQGLEPMDSWDELCSLLFHFRVHKSCFDPFVIYTGYTKDEIKGKICYLKRMYSNIIVKYGRFIPDNKPHFDNVLGVKLASDNQYAEQLDDEYDCFEDEDDYSDEGFE